MLSLFTRPPLNAHLWDLIQRVLGRDKAPGSHMSFRPKGVVSTFKKTRGQNNVEVGDVLRALRVRRVRLGRKNNISADALDWAAAGR
jgi:hypothetical protein